MTKSVAQLTARALELEAELEASKEETRQAREAAKKATQRVRWPTGLWPNQNRLTELHPEHQGCFRIVVPPNLQAGDYLWIDASLWIYDPKTSPVTYEKNPPAYNFSASPTDPEYAEIREAARKKALREKALQQGG